MDAPLPPSSSSHPTSPMGPASPAQVQHCLVPTDSSTFPTDPHGPCHPPIRPFSTRQPEGSFEKVNGRLLICLQSFHFFLFFLRRRSSSYCSLESPAHPPLSRTVPSVSASASLSASLCQSLWLLSVLSSHHQVPTPTRTFAQAAFSPSKKPHPAYTLFQLEDHSPSETPLTSAGQVPRLNSFRTLSLSSHAVVTILLRD